ncbi:Putative 8-oxo-dGTP diphosphatase 3 [Nocardioides aquaticus]|uniref:8-oxo-dGTP diphosphatase 3 n=1 Tax=Nocardioides aquaticus TaxID=160826 RepID=A0ABX8EMS8_9ACTN|nr:NUDIX hydrolase [Nocardioides aquaticus]QVT81819.1 Putative 8-oxo-dGTP diphosphatase 3 [Nocardioides aquaticus]
MDAPHPDRLPDPLPDYTEYDTRLAAYVLLTEDRPGGRRVLLALWNEGDRPQWTLPGGGAELHEGVEQTAVREVREETGYDVVLGDVLWVSSYVITPSVATATRTGR